MNWLLYALAGGYSLALLCMIAIIGKPRQPLTPGVAIPNLLFGVAIVGSMVAAAWRMT